MTPYTNPWNEIYRLAAGKRKSTAQITTLRKPDGSFTADVHETLKKHAGVLCTGRQSVR